MKHNYRNTYMLAMIYYGVPSVHAHGPVLAEIGSSDRILKTGSWLRSCEMAGWCS